MLVLSIKILASLAVAAALQAKLPNPFYARGAVAVKYSLLAGLVKGSAKVAFEIGQECQISQPAQANTQQLAIISDMTPANDQKDVEVMTQPEVSFEVPIGNSFEGEDGSSLRAELVADTLRSLKSGYDIPYKLAWDESRMSVKFKSYSILPKNDSLLLSVSVKIFKGSSLLTTEYKKVVFTTGGGLNYIPDANVEFAYPMAGQYNYYSEQIAEQKGYIQLKYGQNELFSNLEADQSLQVRYKTNTSSFTYQPATYEYSQAKVSYSLPASSLQKGAVYQLELVSINNDKTTEKVLYKLFFRASQYATFGQKITALKNTNMAVVKNGERFKNIIGNNFEPFDKYELFGGDNFGALVEVKADLSVSPLYNQYSTPFYDGSLPSNVQVDFDEGEKGCAEVKGTLISLASPKVGDVAWITQLQTAKSIVISNEDFKSFQPVTNNGQYIEYLGNEYIVNHVKSVSTKIHDAVQAVLTPWADCKSSNKPSSEECIQDALEYQVNSVKDIYQNYEEFMNLSGPSGTYKVTISYRCSRLNEGQPDSVQEISLIKN
jgi:hypothetical protein